MQTPLLEINDLSVIFAGRKVLDKVSFQLTQGEYVGLIGPNGAGKSTLLKAILGIIKYTGNIKITPNLKIGYVPQKILADNYFSLSVKEFLTMSLTKNSFANKKAANEAMQEKIREVGLQNISLANNFHTLSEGQKQRIIIARSLLHQPQLLLFDEPLSWTDYESRFLIYKLLAELNKKLKITILFVSHEIEQIIAKCQRVLCLNQKLYSGCHPIDFSKNATQNKKCDFLDFKNNTVSVHHHHKK